MGGEADKEASTSDTQTDSGDTRTHNRPSSICTSLDLSSNRIGDITALVAIVELDGDSLRQLTNLQLASNMIRSFPSSLSDHLPSLRQLDLKNNQLGEFPYSVLCCPHLCHLDLSHNNIRHCDIDDDSLLSRLATTALVDLDISDNRLTRFPTALCQILHRLAVLDLSGNNIDALPEADLVMGSLVELRMRKNALQRLTAENMACFSAVRTLILEDNQIVSLPTQDCALKCGSLDYLNLNGNCLGENNTEEFPAFITFLQRLRVLKISKNRLHHFPHAVKFRSTNLKEINVSHNKLRRFPIGSHAAIFGKLQELNLSHNALLSLPKELGEIVSLTSLDLSHNDRLTTIPDELGSLNRLWDLNLEGMKLDMDDSITKSRPREIVAYLHEKLKQSEEYNYMKLMVVGYGGRGKSTLVHSLMGLKQPKSPLATIGIEVKKWRFVATYNRKSVTYNLSVWDFAGQEDFYASNHCFLSKRALYLVVYDITRGPREVGDLSQWLQNIQAHAPLCPVIVVGTHLDRIKLDERLVVLQGLHTQLRRLAGRPGYPNIRVFTEVDCRSDNYDMEHLRIMIKDVLDDFKVNGQRVIFQKVPASFVRLQELLGRERGNNKAFPVIRHQKLLSVLRKGKLSLDKSELQQAVKFLHNAGVILHYDDPTLRMNDIYFLDPQWLCKMMSQIVTLREINPFITPQGTLRRRDVELLCTGKQCGDYVFPVSLIPQYLRLLAKFEIMLPINSLELLIPSRLPKNRPPISLPVKENESLVRRLYHTAYLPFGLWSRIIIRILTYTNTLLGDSAKPIVKYWREGVYLFLSEHAFVLCEPLDASGIQISVPPTPSGTKLLSSVVDHVDSVVEEWFPGLLDISPTGQPHLQIKVPCIQCRTDAFLFCLDALIHRSTEADTIECPRHADPVPLRLLAPDIILADNEANLEIKSELLGWPLREESLLGNGSFGKVYKTTYNGTTVAAKLFLPSEQTPVYKRMRQEVHILRQLDHPCLIRLLGVDVRNSVILLELAHHGSLRTVFTNKKPISKRVKHRMALQIAEGLNHMHQQKILFRDLKPDNILVFSLQQNSTVNVKICDYGIAKYLSPDGLFSSEGTPGYRAPEVIQGEPYSMQADIFSYGVLLYELLSDGIHPFLIPETSHRIEDSILHGCLEAQSFQGQTVYSELEDISRLCMRPIPEDRPKSVDLVAYLQDVTVLCRMQVFPIGKGYSADCVLQMKGQRDLLLITSSTSCFSDVSQLSHIKAGSSSCIRGTIFLSGQVNAVLPMGTLYLLVGSERGDLFCLDTSFDIIGSKFCLNKVILCMQRCRGAEYDYIVGGTDDGHLFVINTQGLLTVMKNGTSAEDSQSIFQLYKIGDGAQPVVCCSRYSHSCVYFGVGTKVYRVRVYPEVEVATSVDTTINGDDKGIIKIARDKGYLHIVRRCSPIIQKWNIRKTPKLSHTFDVLIFLEKSGFVVEHHYDYRVLALCITSEAIWLGLTNGLICLVDKCNYKGKMILPTGLSHIKSAVTINHEDKELVAVSGCSNKTKSETETEYYSDERDSYLVIFDAHVYSEWEILREYINRLNQFM